MHFREDTRVEYCPYPRLRPNDVRHSDIAIRVIESERLYDVDFISSPYPHLQSQSKSLHILLMHNG